MHWYLIDVSEEGDDVKNTIDDYGVLYDYFHLAEGEGDKRIITLIAEYELIIYTVEFESEFIYDEIESVKFTANKEIVFENGPDFYDYVFKYWYLDIAGEAGIIEIATSDDLLDYSDYASEEGTELIFVLIANYEPIEFTVKFVDEKGNVLDVDSVKFTVKYEELPEFDKAPLITGYHFAYWYLIDEDEIGEDFDGETEICDYNHLTEYLHLAEGDGDERTITLIAKYELITYTVVFVDEKDEPAVSLEDEFTFNVNDESKNFPFGDEVTGYLFGYWYVVGDDNKTSVTGTNDLLNYPDLAEGDDDERSFTLKAYYEPIPYIVNFVDDGGKILKDFITFTIEFDEPTDFGDTPYRAGYVFSHWYLPVEEDGDEFDAPMECPENLLNYLEYFLKTEDRYTINLIAEYSIITYFVEFKYNDKPAISSEPEFCFDVEDDPTTGFPDGDEIQGYGFVGWQIEAAVAIFDVETIGDLIKYLYLAEGEDEEYYLTLTAKYDPIEYTVNFVNGKGETLMDSETFTMELEEPIIFGNAPSLPGYTFEEWFIILEDEDEVSIHSSQDLLNHLFHSEGYDGDNTVTLTARYEPIIYTIIFVDEDGDYLEMDTETYFIDIDQFFFEDAPTEMGYTFKGWYLAAPQAKIPVSKSDDLYSNLHLATVCEDENIIFVTAEYDPIEYTVNFVNGKGETLMDSETFTMELEEPIIFGNAPSLPGYTFEEWFIILEDEDEVSIHSSQDLLNHLFHSEGYDGDNTVTLTARYEPIIYTIEFEPREGVFDEGVSGVIEGLVYNETFSLPDVSREGYTFMGWFIDNKEINPEAFWSDIDHTVNEIKIYAKWQSPDAKDIADGKLVVEIIGDGFTYTGETIAPSVKVWYDEILLGLNDDYTISYGDNINVATGGTIIIFGQDGYKGEFTESFAIKPKSIETAIITVDPKSDLTYTGNGVEPGITVTLDDNAFDAVNYTVEYLNNVNVGTAIVKIIAKNGNYTGTVTESFVITAKTVIVTPESGQSKVYGEADPVLTYLLDDGNAYEFIDGNTSLVRADGNNVNTYKISQGTLAFREGTANYILVFSDVTVTFEITAKDVNAAEFTWDYTEEFVFDNTPRPLH